MDDQGAEMLLSKYLSNFVKRSCQALRLANHVASLSSKHYQIITKVISVTGFGMILNLTSHYMILIFTFLDKLFMELLISLIMVHQKKPLFLRDTDWFDLFIPLLNALDAFNLMTPNLEREEDDNLSWPGFSSKSIKLNIAFSI